MMTAAKKRMHKVTYGPDNEVGLHVTWLPTGCVCICFILSEYVWVNIIPYLLINSFY